MDDRLLVQRYGTVWTLSRLGGTMKVVQANTQECKLGAKDRVRAPADLDIYSTNRYLRWLALRICEEGS